MNLLYGYLVLFPDELLTADEPPAEADVFPVIDESYEVDARSLFSSVRRCVGAAIVTYSLQSARTVLLLPPRNAYTGKMNVEWLGFGYQPEPTPYTPLKNENASTKFSQTRGLSRSYPFLSGQFGLSRQSSP